MLYQIVIDLLSLFYKIYELINEKPKGEKKENFTDSSLKVKRTSASYS